MTGMSSTRSILGSFSSFLVISDEYQHSLFSCPISPNVEYWDQITTVTPTVAIRDVTVQNGYIDYNSGGGLYIDRAGVSIDNSTIQSNTATYAWSGGGIMAYDTRLEISGNLLRGNQATGTNGGSGGGIETSMGQLILRDSRIENNIAALYGGGLNVTDYVSIHNSVIHNNRLVGIVDSCNELSGGGVRHHKTNNYPSIFFYLIESELSNNYVETLPKDCAQNAYGGGIAFVDSQAGDEILIQNSTIVSNSAIDRGGISMASHSLKVLNSDISYNQARGRINDSTVGSGGGLFSIGDTRLISSIVSYNSAATEGGGLYIVGDSHAITDSLIAHNQAGSEGGGLWSESVSIYRSTVRNNSAPRGGGLALWDSQIVASTLSHNSATDRGGGIYIPLPGPVVSVRNSTLSHNSAGKGGAFANDGDKGSKTEFINSTIAANQAITEGAGLFYEVNFFDPYSYLSLANTLLADNDGANCAGSVESINSRGHNLSDDGFCLFTGAGDQVKVDAKLGPLQDNPSTGSGQATLSHALLDGSPAINAGNDAACPATDQRGVSRPQGPRCDIGAFEAEVTTPYLFVTPALLEFYAVAGATSPSAKTFTVENSGVGVLNWSASESTPWFSLDKSSGTAPMTVSVAISTTGLNPGSYNADILVSADGAGGSPQTVAVSLTVVHAGSLLLNGDFELGRKSWSEASLKSRALIRQGNDVPHTSPRSGVWAAVLGQVDGEISQLGQTITLPDGDDLSLIYYTFGHSTESQCDAEVARVRIDGQEVAAHPLCQANNSSAWEMHQIDLNAYRGKEVALQFYLANDPTSDPSTLLIDDVRLQLGDQPPPQTQWEIFLPALERGEPPVTAECTPSPTGESDNIGDALTICHDQTVSGHVDQNDYWDVYKIAIDANRAIAINLTGGPGDANMRLYPPGTTSIEDGFLAEWSTAGGTSNESIQGTTLVAGEWFVVVYAWDGTSDYQLKVTIGESVAATSCEPSPPGDSNNVDDALTLCPGQPVSGQVDRNSDMWDVYRVAYADNTATIIELSGQDGNAQMGLYGPSATNVLTDNPVKTSVNPGSDERIAGIIRDPGGWYIAVVNIEDSTDYTLRVTNTFIGSNSRTASAQNAKEKESALDGPAIHPTQRVQWYE